jgi:hypothetical protein
MNRLAVVFVLLFQSSFVFAQTDPVSVSFALSTHQEEEDVVAPARQNPILRAHFRRQFVNRLPPQEIRSVDGQPLWHPAGGEPDLEDTICRNCLKNWLT